MNKKIGILHIFLLLYLFVNAQQNIQPSLYGGCGSDDYVQLLRKQPAYAANEAKINAQIRLINAAKIQQQNSPAVKVNGLSSKGINSISPITGIISIPVVVHIINQNPSSITDQMVKDGIKELNDAFAHQGAYSSDPLGVNTNIQFCLANTAPDGSLTNGIDRIKTYYENIDVDLEASELAKLSQWNPAYYSNIWLVSSIKGEIQPSIFECGKWQRMAYGGYASAGGGLVVSSLSGPLVAHEMGHYLSLLHTFQGMNCANGDCTLDGDLVCDTPPDRSIKSSPCNSPENSCGTDTLSGPFTKDVPDNISNFMDYGSPCPSVFTKGQSDRMNAFLTVFNGGSLLNSNRCSPPCIDNVLAQFDWYANPHPVTGDLVSFNNTSTSATDFEWYVNGVLTATTASFSYLVTTPGIYVVKLLAYNATRSCVSSYTGNVMVDCGVVARFSPNKRIIASASIVYKDPVLFENTSYGATSYKWFVSDNTGANFAMVGTAQDLLYDFLLPGIYKIKLEATNGTCVSVSGVYTLTVQDPKPEGYLTLYQVNCYKTDSIRIVFGVNNSGFDTIHAGTQISFYDQYPGVANANKLNNTFLLTNDLLGKCSVVYTHIVKASKPKQDSLLVVFDENNQVNELVEFNNNSVYQKFQFKITLKPADTLVYTNTNLPLVMQKTAFDALASIVWNPAINLSCNNCATPILKVTDTVLMKVVANTIFDCVDSGNAYIKVFPLDISLTNPSVYCFRNDSLLVTTKICLKNGYTQLKKKIEIEYYDDDLNTGSAIKLGSVWVDSATVFSGGCLMVSTIVKMTNTPVVFVYINREQAQYEPQMIDNIVSVNYLPFKLVLAPNDYAVFRGEKLPIDIINSGGFYKTFQWTPTDDLSCSNCLSTIITTNVNRQYKINATNEYFCTDSTFVNVTTSYRSHLALPNVFTPNGDGLNDYFYVIGGQEVVAVNLFQIFNRWGEKVFEKKNTKPNEYIGGWDGYYKGKLAENGTYVYYIVIGLLDGSTEAVKGNITLYR